MIFEWDSTDYPQLYGLSVEYNDFTNTTAALPDYAHINSIVRDERDGNLVCSFRQFDNVIKIDTTSGELVWILGGKGDQFSLSDEQKSSRQHYAQLNDNGSISIYDNGFANNQSRVVEYWIDEERKLLKDFKEYKIDGYYSWATGSAERLSNEEDIFVIGWGLRSVMDTMPLYPNLSEINFTTGETYFELRFTDSNVSTYRCVKYE